jgi:hypothetical protein
MAIKRNLLKLKNLLETGGAQHWAEDELPPQRIIETLVQPPGHRMAAEDIESLSIH